MDKTISRLIKITLIIVISYFIIMIYQDINSIIKGVIHLLLPFIIGFTGAFILEPFVSWLAKKGWNRKASSVMVVVLAIILLVTIIVIIVPVIGNQLGKLLDNIPNYMEFMKDQITIINQKLNFLPDRFKLNLDNIQLLIEQMIARMIDYLMGLLQTTFSYFLAIIITPILLIYFLIDYDLIINKLKEYLDFHKYYNCRKNLIEIRDTMYTYFKGVIIVIIALSTVAFLAFLLIGLDLPLLWGILIGITDIIPYLGPYIGGGIVVIFAFTMSPKMALTVLLVIVLLQFLEGNILTPSIQSKAIKTHPILVIFSVTFLGKLLGIFGMIIAIPILSIIQIIIKNDYILKKVKKT